jgi:hypothetical protein
MGEKQENYAKNPPIGRKSTGGRELQMKALHQLSLGDGGTIGSFVIGDGFAAVFQVVVDAQKEDSIGRSVLLFQKFPKKGDGTLIVIGGLRQSGVDMFAESGSGELYVIEKLCGQLVSSSINEQEQCVVEIFLSVTHAIRGTA